MIIEKVTRDSYADQLTRRIIVPLRLRTTCLAPYTCPPSDAAGCRPGTSTSPAPAVADRQGHAAASP